MGFHNGREKEGQSLPAVSSQPGVQETGEAGKASQGSFVPTPEAPSLEAWHRFCLACKRCSLRQGARGVVFGEGNPGASILFVGEGPGAEEDKLGRPFVGPAGQLLDRILAAAGLLRQEVYIANVVKCRPPGNRLPHREEIEACLPHLRRQIELIDPPIIVCLGSVASRALIRPDFAITRERGCWYELEKRLLMPTFHPAALLRDPGKKKEVWADIQLVMKLYNQICREGDER